MNNDNNLTGFLPLGSVILLDGGEKRLMIIGRKQISVETQKEFDYAGVLFPEGYQNADQLYLFNADDITYIFQMGLLDSEELSFQDLLNNQVSENHNRIYLDEKRKLENIIQKIAEMNATIESEWKGQYFADYLKTYEEFEKAMTDFIKHLEKGDALLQEHEEKNMINIAQSNNGAI
ncbi:MAG: DUF4176 domain-containing protein [Streptococcaceae bacterium]|jgi:hypothetical protein|nr:DUF4176 domain-containing protein [Streptococcaceae bacterium]